MVLKTDKMINDLLIKYKNQKPKNFGNGVTEKTYPVSAVIAMLEEVKQRAEGEMPEKLKVDGLQGKK